MKLNKLNRLIIASALLALLTACGDDKNSINTLKNETAQPKCKYGIKKDLTCNKQNEQNFSNESYIEINGGSENRKP